MRPLQSSERNFLAAEEEANLVRLERAANVSSNVGRVSISTTDMRSLEAPLMLATN